MKIINYLSKLILKQIYKHKTNELLAEVVSKQLGNIDPYSVLKIDAQSGKLKFYDEPITEDELKQIRNEVSSLKGSRVYKIINETLRSAAVDRLVLLSGTNTDTVFAKACLYELNSINVILNSFLSENRYRKVETSSYLESMGQDGIIRNN